MVCSDGWISKINTGILGSIARLKQVKNSLEAIALIDLAQITENGLGNLTELKSDKKIFFRNFIQILI